MNENDFLARLRDSDLSASAKLVVRVMLEYRNRKTGECYPSHDTIAAACSLVRNTVSKAVKELIDKGFISAQKRRPEGARFECFYYTFSFEQSNQCATGETSKIERSGFERPSERSPREHKPIEPINLSSEAKASSDRLQPSDSKQKHSDDPKAAMEIWNEFAGSHGLAKAEKLTQERIVSLKARIKDAGGLDGFRNAVQTIAFSTFLLGQSEKGWRADFDWVLKRKSFVKLMEGGYTNGRKYEGTTDTEPANIAAMSDDDWQPFLFLFRTNHSWPDGYGPPPNDRNTLVPKHLLAA